MLRAAVPKLFCASVALTVKPGVPVVVGVPLITPVAGFSVSPFGSAPVWRLHV